ncbi:MAG: carboxypeptidase-like regulatory domain-containing protein [Bacteroidia bacterium]|nr:carboxypeptidase-like regulatory domain-containing protein [Bacteroidia bacterium]MDW8302093.1 carboxypeptidase-like regulatory domain-containing protein [Bacteroidia bacterium]
MCKKLAFLAAFFLCTAQLKAQLLSELLKIIEPTIDKKPEKEVLFGNIRGIICDYETSELIPNARVIITGTPFETYSNENGMYELTDIPDGEYELVFIHKDYMKKKMRPVTVLGNTDLAMRVTLDRIQRSLDDTESETEVFTIKDELERFNNMIGRKNVNKKLIKLAKYTAQTKSENYMPEIFALSDDLKVVLDSIAAFLKKHSEANIVLCTYTQNPTIHADVAKRNTLHRATLMQTYIIQKHKIDKQRISVEGLGKYNPHKESNNQAVVHPEHHLIIKLK